MKNVLLKFAGLFVERVPVDERGNPLPATPPPPRGAGATAPGGAPTSPGQPTGLPQQHPQHPPGHPAHPGGTAPAMYPTPGQPAMVQPLQGAPIQPGSPGAAAPGSGAAISVALRAWVPQEYAAHLAPYGLHVIAAGGSVSSEQARGWGADVLVVSAECLGQDVHLLQQPQLPTVFITPQPVMIPDVPGVVQVQEPLRASDVAQATRDAAAAFAAARR